MPRLSGKHRSCGNNDTSLERVIREADFGDMSKNLIIALCWRKHSLKMRSQGICFPSALGLEVIAQIFGTKRSSRREKGSSSSDIEFELRWKQGRIAFLVRARDQRYVEPSQINLSIKLAVPKVESGMIAAESGLQVVEEGKMKTAKVENDIFVLLPSILLPCW